MASFIFCCISGANAAVAARGDAERVFALIWTAGGAITKKLVLTKHPDQGGMVSVGTVTAQLLY